MVGLNNIENLRRAVAHDVLAPQMPKAIEYNPIAASGAQTLTKSLAGHIAARIIEISPRPSLAAQIKVGAV
jgi:hypothetical protein